MEPMKPIAGGTDVIAAKIMDAAKGLRTDQMVRVIHDHPHGVNWRGCSKSTIAKSLAEDADKARTRRMGDMTYTWRETLIPKLIEALRDEPRPEKRSAKKKREAETKRREAEVREAEVNKWVAEGGTLKSLEAEIQRCFDQQHEATVRANEAREARFRLQTMKLTMRRMEAAKK